MKPVEHNVYYRLPTFAYIGGGGGAFLTKCCLERRFSKKPGQCLTHSPFPILGITILCDVFFNNVCGANLYAT